MSLPSTTYRRASRPADRRLVGGVATGLADHFSAPVLAVRATFVVATFFNLAGIFAYLILWRLLPLAEPELPAGLESASRRGLRSGRGRIGPLEVLQTVAVASFFCSSADAANRTWTGGNGSWIVASTWTTGSLASWR